MKDKIPLIIVIIIVIAIIALAVVFGVKKEGEKGELRTEESLSEGSEIAEEIYGFSGEIKEIQNKTLLIEAKILMANPEEEAIKTLVKAVVTDDTKITKLEFPEISEGSTEPIYPEETEMSFEELKVGDKIDVGAFNNISRHIKDKTEFDLKHIFIIIIEK